MVVRRDGEDPIEEGNVTDVTDESDERDTTTDPPRSHLTTIVLEERGDGSWRATQHGVSVAGHGGTAAAAAAAYCRAVADSSD